MLSMHEIHDPAHARGYYYEEARQGWSHPSGAFVSNVRATEMADIASLTTLLDGAAEAAEYSRWRQRLAAHGDVIFTARPTPALTLDPLAAAYRDIQDRGAAVRGGLAILSAEWDRTRPQVRAMIEADRAARRARWWRAAKIVGAASVAAACAWAALL